MWDRLIRGESGLARIDGANSYIGGAVDLRSLERTEPPDPINSGFALEELPVYGDLRCVRHERRSQGGQIRPHVRWP